MLEESLHNLRTPPLIRCGSLDDLPGDNQAWLMLIENLSAAMRTATFGMHLHACLCQKHQHFSLQAHKADQQSNMSRHEASQL